MGYFAQLCIGFSADSTEQTVLCVKKCAGLCRYLQAHFGEARKAACGPGRCS